MANSCISLEYESIMIKRYSSSDVSLLCAWLSSAKITYFDYDYILVCLFLARILADVDG